MKILTIIGSAAIQLELITTSEEQRFFKNLFGGGDYFGMYSTKEGTQ